MFESVLERLYKLKAGDFDSKYLIVNYLDDLVNKCDISNVAFLSRTELLSLICVYKIRKILESYEYREIGTYTFRKKVDEVKKSFGLDTKCTYKTITIQEAEDISDMLEISIGSVLDENTSGILKSIGLAMFEE